MGLVRARNVDVDFQHLAEQCAQPDLSLFLAPAILFCFDKIRERRTLPFKISDDALLVHYRREGYNHHYLTVLLHPRTKSAQVVNLHLALPQRQILDFDALKQTLHQIVSKQAENGGSLVQPSVRENHLQTA